jgi:hypothetical protein
MRRTSWILVFFSLVIDADSFVVAPKKKHPRLTIEDICHNMMPENIITARINSLLGQNQVEGLSWIDDVMQEDKNALFNLATQEELQQFNQEEQGYIANLKHFEKVLHDHQEFLKNWKHKVSSPKKSR